MPEFLTLSPEMLKVLPTFPQEIWETFYAAVVSTFFAYIIGLPLGILFVAGERGGILKLPYWLIKFLDVVVNILRSVPFLILMIMVVPLSMLIIGTRIGTVASIIPLIIAAAPFVARMVESSLREVDKGVIEAAQAMGCSPWQIIVKVMLPESLPSLLTGATIALTTILGYAAMAGAIGGGGLGKVAINNGLYRYNPDIMLLAVVLLVIMVQIFQSIGTWLAARSDKRFTHKRKGRF